MNTDQSLMGFTCAYTPIPVISAAGLVPYRIFPDMEGPDASGTWLHDNLCPHVKGVLNRALSGDLPELAGMVIVNSCDAMRRLSDAWQVVRPNDWLVTMDLPVTTDADAIGFWAGEIVNLVKHLENLTGNTIAKATIEDRIAVYDTLADRMEQLKKVARHSGVRIQKLYNQVATTDPELVLQELDELLEQPGLSDSQSTAIPIYLFGNMLPDPEAIQLFEDAGAVIVEDDICTGGRLLAPKIPGTSTSDNIFMDLATRGLLRPPCARTIHTQHPGQLGDAILTRVKAVQARGVIAHTLKFCDPYLDRLPDIRDQLQKAGIPMLILEGDCTLGAFGQQRTRIEAFIEMLR